METKMLEVLANICKWYSTQPFFTRTYLSVCILFTLLISLNLISSYHVFYTFEATFFRLHIWRPLTAFLFIEKLDIVFLVSLYVLYFSLNRLERQIVTGAHYAQFLWMVVLLLGSCIAIGTLIHVYFLTDMLIIALIFISAQKLPSQRIPLFSSLTIESTLLLS
jgi:Derlin-2/3